MRRTKDTVPRFLIDDQQLRNIAQRHGTPCFVYSRDYLLQRAQTLLDIEMPYGFTARYAVKANMHPDILRLFDKVGLAFDASSDYEVEALLEEGIAPQRISLSSQQSARDYRKLLNSGVQIVATSRHQLDLVAASGYRGPIGIRINPGMGDGFNNRMKTGGRTAAFGIWHEYIPEVKAAASDAGLRIERLHVHIGTGTKPSIWREVIDTCLSIAEQFPDVTYLDIGGGFKIRYMPNDEEADMQAIALVFADALDAFAQKTGRELHLEIEPGRWLVANAGVLLTAVDDIVDTGTTGYTFLRLNTGMNDFIRPAMYGSQHRIEVLSDTQDEKEYVLVGHCCESSDIFTTEPGDPEAIQPRYMRRASIGDIVAIYGTGAYCASMSTKGYNGYSPAAEVMV